ncbi:hypothetical protein AVEN_196370-1 [Araneus ventricosus]|uniref:Uncharacterized protein n=1 Tax=Araneus ventricosus TaxID=182803 RepID=A0A4Y2AWI9_ARAVE|nr:hypothetical protein AVEN_196370-1 [Araneus ventricosus]
MSLSNHRTNIAWKRHYRFATIWNRLANTDPEREQRPLSVPSAEEKKKEQSSRETLTGRSETCSWPVNSSFWSVICPCDVKRTPCDVARTLTLTPTTAIC